MSLTPTDAAQLAQVTRDVDGAASRRIGLIAVPHRVQNLSLGSASFPHSAQTHPVRRKRASRAPIRSPPRGLPAGDPSGVGPPPAGPPAYGPPAAGDVGAMGGGG
jgi:hypothetical protein